MEVFTKENIKTEELLKIMGYTFCSAFQNEIYLPFIVAT